MAPFGYSILTFAIAMIFAGIWQDRRGMIVGLSVMGAGFGPLLYDPLIERLIGKDQAAWQTTIPHTFFIVAGLLAVGMVGTAQFMKLPPPDWKPADWTPPVERTSTIDVKPGRMIRTWQFYALWAFTFLSSAVGLVGIGAAALIQEVSRVEVSRGSVAAFSGGIAVGVMSVFNGSGPLLWGTISDRFGRKAAMLGISSLAALACFAFFRPRFGFRTVITGLCLAAAGFGGLVALIPALLAD